jgi:hypothetical protein
MSKRDLEVTVTRTVEYHMTVNEATALRMVGALSDEDPSTWSDAKLVTAVMESPRTVSYAETYLMGEYTDTVKVHITRIIQPTEQTGS